MSISDNNGNGRFEDIWQGILPGLEPLPPAVRNFDSLSKQPVEEKPASPEPPAPVSVTMKGTSNYAEEIDFLKARREQESDILRFYQTLIRKGSRRMAQELIPLEKAQKQVLNRLITVYFLKTGEKGKPGSSCPFICSVPHAIRNLCNEEAVNLDEYTRAAAEYERLRPVCEEIAQIKAHSARELEILLGRIMSR